MKNKLKTIYNIMCSKKSQIKTVLLTLIILLYHSQSFSQIASDIVKAQKIFQNDICLPSTLYMLENTQNNIFIEPLIKRWKPFDDVVRFSGTSEYSRRLQRVASINKPIDGASITLDLVNQDEFNTIKTLSATIEVGKPGVGKNPITISIIGDSFTNGAFFKDALLEKGYVPNIKMIGLRDVVGHSDQFDEGRGGWTLKSYFTVTNKRTQPYNGFWQPTMEYKYWGSTDFWKLAKEIHANPKNKWTFNEKYNAGRFVSKSTLFDDKNGYKLNPKKNDIMYDNTLESYVKFNGAKWKKVNYQDFDWGFNYSKYLSMWNLEHPMILAEFLGLNDFRDAPNPSSIDFTAWNSQMEQVIRSYLKTVPSGKFVLMIPSSTCGILDNKAGDFTTKQNACMWELRKNIIDMFDHRTAENIYIIDAGIAIDNLDGSKFLKDSTYTLPYAEYSGKEKIAVQTGNPHPYPNYPTMGISLAAFIQKFRSR
ncbi:MAG: hypothetical protein ABJL44_03665 [Algibacter sp.]